MRPTLSWMILNWEPEGLFLYPKGTGCFPVLFIWGLFSKIIHGGEIWSPLVLTTALCRAWSTNYLPGFHIQLQADVGTAGFYLCVQGTDPCTMEARCRVLVDGKLIGAEVLNGTLHH